jgi:hypothetical protein
MRIFNHKLIALMLGLFFSCSLVQAAELWTNNQANSRYYLSFKEAESGVNLNQYYQVKGDYQTLIKSYRFINKTEAKKFIVSKFPSYITTHSLTVWPIRVIEDPIISDKFFGRGRGSSKNQYIWFAKNQWNSDWEEKYSYWIANVVTPDFLAKYKIQTDCADAIVALRWIFARMNSLPAANTLADTGNVFGQWSMRSNWKKLSTADKWYDDELFKTALNYVLDLTSTETVIGDGFPIKISKETLVPGTFIITRSKTNGHARLIAETHYDEPAELPIITLASTLPRAVRILTREVFLDQAWTSPGEKEILAFRWPVVSNSNWILQKRDARPTYSLEQFDAKNKEQYPIFFQFVLSRVKTSYDPLKLVDMALANILDYAKQRVQVVSDGYAYCKNHDCRPGTEGDDNWGTQSRDDKLLKKFQDTDALILEFEKQYPGLSETWTNGLRNTTFLVEGVPLTLAGLRFILENNFYSSVGSETPAGRWGLNTQERLTKLSASVVGLLDQRNMPIIRPETPCAQDCNTKTDKWNALNTYHQDADLNSIYVQIATYCSIIDVKGCQIFFAKEGQKSFTYNDETKSLQEWINLIPYFHSDPRVTIARRWGHIPENLKISVLPYYQTIKIAKNSLAVLDSRKLMNLKTGMILTEVDAASRLVITASGVVYKINDVLGDIKRMSLDNEDFKWIKVVDPDNLMALEINRPVFIEEDKGYTIFRKSLSQGAISFRIINDKIEFIKEYRGKTQHKGSLLTVVLDKDSMSFIDLDRTINVDILSPANENSFDMNDLEIASYSYPNVLLNYRNDDLNKNYSLIINLQTKNWTKVAPSITEKNTILWSDISLKKAIVQTKYWQDYPELYAISWDSSNEFQVQKLDNQLKGITSLDGTVYLISAVGGTWDQNFKTKIYSWNSNLNELNSPQGLDIKFLNSIGFYSTSNDVGNLRTFSESKDIDFPRLLASQDEFCQIQSQSEEILSYRFSTAYGDYSCMGGSLLKSDLTNSNSEVIPQFSQYAWISSENLLDVRWREIFKTFDVQSGALVSLGKNISVWWGSK